MAYDIDQIKMIFDELSTKVEEKLGQEYAAGRIKGTEYADVYNQLMQAILGLSFEAPTKEAQQALTEAQQALAEEQTIGHKYDNDFIKPQQLKNLQKDELVKDSQIELTQRQKEGFDDNIRQKMLEIQMNSWAMMFSSGMLEEKPSIIQNDEVSDLYCFMKSQAGVTPEPC